MRKHIATALQATGTIIVSMSLAMYSPPLGLGFAGIGLVVFGIAAERNQ